ncbi:hypothetical protein DPEC_G00134940 [Dallia pectoralis]|uniref:Uncharacterized protein n=1 Tax=Dallia pectoralis TaxID=75939 RepID=A0ACC2GSH8_DALPE|nr:hypothetical protein DPEC_G00378640 [Dallia pectoralis]KAJ7983561.1 hypothetical protein DPEC_G00376680 [Dallia pectoralis]KAJ7983790.1 hypothetical protein DPEC_G00371320 [Dallia pectoralis]KAJ7983977.1 hypothetical protein DPEC_G00368200 [Dallia pectoralis]KAJ7984242.1 hypothetical protein DPEC_G00362630 [Dallia pectoralis]
MAAPHERRHVPEDEPGLAFSPEQSFSSPVSPVQMSSTTPGPLALDFDVALCSTAGTRTPDRATSVPARKAAAEAAFNTCPGEYTQPGSPGAEASPLGRTLRGLCHRRDGRESAGAQAGKSSRKRAPH